MITRKRKEVFPDEKVIHKTYKNTRGCCKIRFFSSPIFTLWAFCFKANIEKDCPNFLFIAYGKVTKNDLGVLECTLDIELKKPLALDVPEGLNMVVDGTVRAKVMMEDIYVGDVDFPLPIYGIPCDMTKSVTLDGMCARSMEYDGKYTLELAEEQNLWVMEA